MAGLGLLVAMAGAWWQRSFVAVFGWLVAAHWLYEAGHFLRESRLGWLAAVIAVAPLRICHRGRSRVWRWISISVSIVLSIGCGGWAHRLSTSPCLWPAPLTLSRWSSASPLSLSSDAAQLKSADREARVFPGSQDLLVNWTAQGGGGEVRVLLENLGRPDQVRVVSGEVALSSAWGGRTLLRASFPESGGSARIRPRGFDGEQPRVLVLGRGTPESTLERIERFASPAALPELLVTLGMVGSDFDYSGRLAARDAIESLRLRSLHLPDAEAGVGERARRAQRSLGGPFEGPYNVAGVCALGADLIGPDDRSEVLGQHLFAVNLARDSHPVVGLVNGPIFGQSERRGVTLPPFASERAERTWAALKHLGARLLVMPSADQTRQWTQDGIQVVEVADRGAVWLTVTRKGGGVESWIPVASESLILRRMKHVPARWKSLSDEHREVGHWSCAALLALSNAVAALFPGRTRRRNS